MSKLLSRIPSLGDEPKLVVLNFMSWTLTCCVELHEHQVAVMDFIAE
jgi:hypothetical protein